MPREAAGRPLAERRRAGCSASKRSPWRAGDGPIRVPRVEAMVWRPPPRVVVPPSWRPRVAAPRNLTRRGGIGGPTRGRATHGFRRLRSGRRNLGERPIRRVPRRPRQRVRRVRHAGGQRTVPESDRRTSSAAFQRGRAQRRILRRRRARLDAGGRHRVARQRVHRADARRPATSLPQDGRDGRLVAGRIAGSRITRPRQAIRSTSPTAMEEMRDGCSSPPRRSLASPELVARRPLSVFFARGPA